MDFYRRCGNVARTCRHFGISRLTFYRWRRRYDPQDLTSLESRSHRPHRRRRPTWSAVLAERFWSCAGSFLAGARNYQVTPCSLEMKKLNRELRQWEKIYNTVRPH